LSCDAPFKFDIRIHFQYGIQFTTFNNTATAILVPLGYVVLWLILRKQKSQASISIQTSNAEQRLQLQAVLICAPTCTASLFYYLAPKFTSNIVVFQMLHIIWISSNGEFSFVPSERRLGISESESQFSFFLSEQI
jgi:hypothetical protein